MNLRHPTTAALLLTLAACGGESTALDNVASVRVMPESPSIDVGLTVQFTAEALDASGNIVPGITFEWSSSNASVATVNDDGLASALTVGTTAITANAGGSPGSQALLVEPSQCESRIDVLLDVGQFQTYDGDQCLLLPSGQVGDRYRVAVFRPTLIEDPDDTPDVWLEINPVLAAEQAPEAVPVAPSAVAPSSYSTRHLGFDASERLDGAPFVRDHRIMDRTRRFHTELRQRERDLGLHTRAVLPSRPARAAGPTLVDPPDRDDLFTVLDCSSGEDPTPVQLIDFNDDVAIYQDSVSNESDPLSTVATGMMLDYFDSYVAGFVEDYWGTTPDIDANERVLITTSPSLPDSAAAAVFSGDFNDAAGCATSNEGEVMYFAQDIMEALDAPDPEDVSYLALGVMAHELKHVTSLYHSVQRGAFHNIWIEEGTAEISQTMSSRIAWADVGGPAVGSAVTGGDIIAWNNDNGGIGPEAWGVVGQLADLVVHLSTQPNSLITNPDGASDGHSFYAGGWHWHRFIGDAYGGASTPLADGPLFEEMTDSQTPAGTGALSAVTGRSFDELFEELIVAMSFHDAGPEPTLAFTTWDLNTAAAVFASPPPVAPPHRYPWPVTTNVPGDPNTAANPSRPFSAGVYSCPPQLVGNEYELADPSDRCAMGPSGIRFFDFTSGGQGAGSQVQVFGAASGKLIVTRVN